MGVVVVIEFADAAIQTIRHEGEKAYPRECCGLLLGRTAGGRLAVASAFPCRNLKADVSYDRYEVDPRDFLRADRLARDQGLEVIGAYHSHPDQPAKPSPVDARESLQGFLYVIVEVREGRAGRVRSWLALGDGEFRELAIRPAAGDGDW